MNEFQESELDLESQTEQNSDIWLSISDLMSGLLMFFALLFIVVQVQLQEKLQELRRYQEALRDLPLVVLAEIRKEMGGNQVQVDPTTGDITISDQILFDEGSDVLNERGKTFLRSFVPVYSRVIFSDKRFENLITYVVIEGHTSSKGLPEFNRALSLRRSLSVANYIFSNNLQFPTKAKFETKVLIAGRGEVDARQDQVRAGDRKVMFRFQLRRPDLEEMLKGVQSNQTSQGSNP
jgi:outer membrane protein OmpA-like peptidoglycan-associated protein